jgi:iron complex outermembrane receptor protein
MEVGQRRPPPRCRDRGISLLSAVVGAACTLPLAGHSEPQAPTEVESIVVTAQKREEDVSKVPITVQALGGKTLLREGVDNLKDVVDMVPNASLAGESSQGTEVYQMRGVAVGDTSGDATVASYLDDFAYSIPGSPYAPPADLYDINRVEVLKGPQGTLYGSSSLGGAIKIVTNDPDLDNFGVTIRGSAAGVWEHSYNYSGDLMLNMPVVKDKLAIRLVLSDKHLSGISYVPFLNLQNANKSDTVLGRVKILWRPIDRLSIDASFWRYEVNQAFTNRLDFANPPTDISYSPGKSPTDYSLFTLRAKYDLGWADLVSASGYMLRHYSIILKGCQLALCYDLNTYDRTTAFHQELRLTSKDNHPFKWIGGLFFMDANDGAITDFNITPPIIPNPEQSPPIDQHSTSHIKSREFAAFGEASYDLFGGRLRPLVGLRYSYVDRTLAQNSTFILNGGPPVLATGGVGGTFQHVSPRFNLSYYPSADGMIYVNVAEGFRPGALQTASTVASLNAVLGVQTSEQLRTDSLWSYEVGAKWAFFDRALSVALAGYYITWDQAQLQTGLSGVSGVLNVGNIRGDGVELYALYRTPIRGLSAEVAAGWNQTKLEDIDPHILSALTFLHNGMQLPPVPKFSSTLRLSYERPTGWYDTNFLADVRYQHRAKEMDLSTGLVSATLDIVDADIGIRRGNLLIQAFCDNIGNQLGPSIWEQARMIVPRPRTIGMRLSDAF